MSLHMFKCQISNIFHQFKWVLCEKCHHSPLLCVALFQNCDLCLFQLGNLLVFSFKFSLVLTAKCTGKDDLMLFLEEDYLTALLSHNNWTLPSSLRWKCCCVLDLTLCKTLQNFSKQALQSSSSAEQRRVLQMFLNIPLNVLLMFCLKPSTYTYMYNLFVMLIRSLKS